MNEWNQSIAVSMHKTINISELNINVSINNKKEKKKELNSIISHSLLRRRRRTKCRFGR